MALKNWLISGNLKRKVQEEPPTPPEDHASKQTENSTVKDDVINVEETDNLMIEKNDSNFPSPSCSKGEEKVKQSKHRKYDVSYLSYGFSYCGPDFTPSPQCVICGIVLTNESMRPSKLKGHFSTFHSEHKGKPLAFFERMKQTLQDTKNTMKAKYSTDNENTLEASYKISYRIANQGEAHTIGERLIKPCALDIAQCMLSPADAKKIESIPLSDNTVQRRIQDCADFILAELVKRLRSCKYYVLQLDESTDVCNLAILLVFVRYVCEDGTVHEDILMCHSLESRTTGEEIFNAVDGFMSKHEISWLKLIDVCTDGARAMTGKTAGVIARMKAVAPHCKSSHCILHRQALAMKGMPSNLKEVLDTVVKLVNFIKSRALNSRIFKIICNELGSVYECLLYHTEVRWLSRGKVLKRFFSLKNELVYFFNDHTHEKSGCLGNLLWMQKLAYLSDIFAHLNELNLSIQGESTTVLTAADKIRGFKLKLSAWSQRAQNNNFESFETLSNFFTETESSPELELKTDIIQHLQQLQENLNFYFPANTEDLEWLRNPFQENINTEQYTAREGDQLIDISSNRSLKEKFHQKPLINFWSSLLQEYPEISERAVKILLPFATTYLCESGFSIYCATKTKYRSRLDAEADVRLQLSTIEPDFKILMSSKQAHPSH